MEHTQHFDSVGVRNHFSTAHEQWQNGLVYVAIYSIMRLARAVTAESGFGGDSGSRHFALGKIPATSPASSAWGQHPTACTVN